MSINLTRRDALKGAMAAGVALAASPYLLNLAGGLQVSPATKAPALAAAVAPVPSAGVSGAAGGDTTVLVIKGDTVRSFSGMQTIKVQDAVLASRLKSAVQARME